MRIALAQINTTVGAIAANTALVLEGIERGRGEGAELIVFPELTITGYPPRDLLDHASFIQANAEALEEVARATAAEGSPGVIVGYAQPSGGEGRGLHNAAALIEGGRTVSKHYKSLLPTYDVFDELRHFDPAPEVHTAEFRGMKLAITICEDFWNDRLYWKPRKYAIDPVEELAKAAPDLMITISASPFAVGKPKLRAEMYSRAAARYGVPIVHVNLVGGNDSLIFDGGSNIWGADGKIYRQAMEFHEDHLVAELERVTRGAMIPATVQVGRGAGGEEDIASLVAELESELGIKVPSDLHEAIDPLEYLQRQAGMIYQADEKTRELEEIHEALKLGIRDYVRKCGFKRVVIGLSGGIDSALTAAIARDALGADAVTGVAMPSEFSSSHSVADARALAGNLGIDFHVLPIEPVYEEFLGTLAPVFKDLPFGVAEENLQARIRGNLLMAISNKFGWLVLTTGNKSEMAVGYCTLYGDMSGGLSVLGDVVKTRVYELARWINRDRERIPKNTIEKPPSAELRPDQLDTDSLPPYEELDPIIEAYIEEHLHTGEIVALGSDPAIVDRVIRMIDRNEYKRQQAPVTLKVTGKAFGSGRRMPIARGDWT